MISKKSKIFVAGHNGLVGSAIVRRLKDQGYKNIILRNKVAVINSEQSLECNLQVALSEINFKEILVGRSNPVALIASGQIVIYKGSSSDFLKFLTSFR